MNKTVVIVAAAGVLCFAIAAVTILLALDHSAVQLIGLLTAVVAPAITSFVALVKVENASAAIIQLQTGQQDKDHG